ncbi:unnamed protein product, partial [marine sediment metagenome]
FFVVDFTIECDPDGPIFVGEWLMWDWSVGYFERSVSQCQVLINEKTFVVRASMP